MPHFGGKNAKKKSSSSTTKRNFTVVIGLKEHGLYVSSSPSSAARKAVSKLAPRTKRGKCHSTFERLLRNLKRRLMVPI